MDRPNITWLTSISRDGLIFAQRTSFFILFCWLWKLFLFSLVYFYLKFFFHTVGSCKRFVCCCCLWSSCFSSLTKKQTNFSRKKNMIKYFAFSLLEWTLLQHKQTKYQLLIFMFLVCNWIHADFGHSQACYCITPHYTPIKNQLPPLISQLIIITYIVPICFTIIIAQFLVLYLLHLISEFSYQEYVKVQEHLVVPSLAPHPKPWQIWTQIRFKCFKDFEHVPFIVISYENKLFADKNSYGVYFFYQMHYCC